MHYTIVFDNAQCCENLREQHWKVFGLAPEGSALCTSQLPHASRADNPLHSASHWLPAAGSPCNECLALSESAS